MITLNKSRAKNKTAAPRNKERRIQAWQAAHKDLIAALVDNPGLVAVAKAASDFLKK
jgi:hypothetical protein